MPVDSQSIVKLLKQKGAHFINIVDISNLPKEQNRGYISAIVFGIRISEKFLAKVVSEPNYIKKLKQHNWLHDYEFHEKEKATDALADMLAEYLNERGSASFSQSEQSVYNAGLFNIDSKTTPLPHKTIAVMAGLGWIGKNNLLINPEFGCGFSMSSVLTKASLSVNLEEKENSLCGDCNVCVEICPVQVLSGKSWTSNTHRDELLNVNQCIACLECMAHCIYS